MFTWFAEPSGRVWKLDKPLLASWDSKAHPSQVRLAEYRDQLRAIVGDHIDAAAPDHALTLRVPASAVGDLDNYLTPVVEAFGWQRFITVWATKAGDATQLTLGRAAPAPVEPEDGWQVH